jgi:hydroxymethylpyrimidine/phosphomethylpyrimidine kinase
MDIGKKTTNCQPIAHPKQAFTQITVTAFTFGGKVVKKQQSTESIAPVRHLPEKSLKQNGPNPVMLAIGGSDNSAGAGIQADLCAAQSVGVRCLTAIACLTSQTDDKFFSLWPVAPAIVRAQITDLWPHFAIGAVKTGALGSAETVLAVADALRASMTSHQARVIVDPVLGSSAGGAFASSELISAYRQALLSQAWLATPNQHELHALGGLETLFDSGLEYVLVTGGDAVAPVDRLYQREGAGFRLQKEWSRQKIPLQLHGSGCRLTSGIAARLVCGMTLIEAIEQAAEQVRKDIVLFGKKLLK